MKFEYLIGSLLLMAGMAFGQGQFSGGGGNGVTTTGTITPGDCVSFASTTQIQDAGAACGGAAPVTSVFTRTGAVVAANGDYSVGQVTGAAPLASPTFTGVPAAPTPGTNINTTQIPTTAWVNTFYAPLASPSFTGTVTLPGGAALGTPTSETLTNATGLPLNGLVGAAAANTITESAVLRPTTFAGVETANLTYPYVFQNSNSTNNNTSGALLANCTGTDTSPTCLMINGPAATGIPFSVVTGGTVTNGVISGQTQVWGVTGAGVVTQASSLTLSAGTITVPAGAAGSASYTFAGDTAGAGIFRAGTTIYGLGGASNEFMRFGPLGVRGTSAAAYGMTSSGTSSSGNYDTCWDRQGAGVARFDANSGCNDGLGKVQAQAYTSTVNCAAIGTAANPSVASCTSATAGSFSCATNASTGTCTVNTTAVTANSEILIEGRNDTTTGTRLGVTCNTGITTALPEISAVVAATSFTINLGTFTTNPECFSFLVVN